MSICQRLSPYGLQQNANQAVRIAELETQINLLQMQIQEMQQQEPAEDKIAGEDPVEVEDMGNDPH